MQWVLTQEENKMGIKNVKVWVDEKKGFDIGKRRMKVSITIYKEDFLFCVHIS